jgi:hypothetical protein
MTETPAVLPFTPILAHLPTRPSRALPTYAGFGCPKL